MTLREQLSFFDELCFLVFLDNRHEGPKKKKKITMKSEISLWIEIGTLKKSNISL